MDLGNGTEFARLWSVMVRSCRHLVDTPEEAEDAASHAVAQAIAKQGVQPRNTEAYLVRSAKCRAIDAHRKKVRERAFAARLALEARDDVVDIAIGVVDRAQIQWLGQEAKRLSPVAKNVFNLTLDGATPAEIAAELGLTLASVRNHLRRTYRTMREAAERLLVLLGVLWGGRKILRAAPAVVVAAAFLLALPTPRSLPSTSA